MGGVIPDSGVIENDIEFDTVSFSYQDLNNPIDAWWASSRNGSYSDFLDKGVFYGDNVDISYTTAGYVDRHKYIPRSPQLYWTIPKGIYLESEHLGFGINSSFPEVYFYATICVLSHLKRTKCQIYSNNLDCYLDSYDEHNNNVIDGCDGVNHMYGLHVEKDSKGILTSKQIYNIFYAGFSYSTYIILDTHELNVVIEKIFTRD